MLTGKRMKANPTEFQKETLSQWMGCSKVIWNAKVQENQYLTTFSRKYLPIGTYPKIDTKYSQYKNPELTPYLAKCPSQILRNSSTNWFNTYKNFMKGLCGKPKKKIFDHIGSLYLTNELFYFEKVGNKRKLFIGTKTNNIGYLPYISKGSWNLPNSIYIKRKNGKFTVSFCYQDHVKEETLLTLPQHLK
ncbi:MAG: putative transposase, partial [bacterium]